MTNRKFAVLSIVSTLTVSGGITTAQILSRTVKTYTATRVVEFYAHDASTPWLTLTEMIGVRDDGSSVLARRNPHPVTGMDVYVRRITDVSNKKVVVVEPLTESLVTYPLGKAAEKQTIKPTTSCPGDPAGEMLGYPVTLQHETIHDAMQTDLRTWRSPALDCAPLREELRTMEEGVENLKLSTVTNIVQGQPERWLFEIPSNYSQRRPTDMMAEQARRYPQRFRMPDTSTNQLDMAYDAAQKQKN